MDKNAVQFALIVLFGVFPIVLVVPVVVYGALCNINVDKSTLNFNGYAPLRA